MKKAFAISQIVIVLLISVLLLISIYVRLTPDITDMEQLEKLIKFITEWSRMEFPIFGALTLFLILITDRKNEFKSLETEEQKEIISTSTDDDTVELE